MREGMIHHEEHKEARGTQGTAPCPQPFFVFLVSSLVSLVMKPRF